jgi:hypothetical protein
MMFSSLFNILTSGVRKGVEGGEGVEEETWEKVFALGDVFW